MDIIKCSFSTVIRTQINAYNFSSLGRPVNMLLLIVPILLLLKSLGVKRQDKKSVSARWYKNMWEAQKAYMCPTQSLISFQHSFIWNDSGVGHNGLIW